MRSTVSRHRLTAAHKLSAAGLTAAGLTALALAAVPGQATAAQSIDVKHVAWTTHDAGTSDQEQQERLTQATGQAADRAKTEAAAQHRTATDAAAKATAQAKARAEQDRAAKETASRSQDRTPVQNTPAAPAQQAPAPAPAKAYGDNLDGWINQALDIMHTKGIPGTYEGLKRNIMRESTGNPQAINNWDSNAVAGIPSKGLLQIIDPTFKAFHVEGTSWDIYDPVANIVASCNYAAKTYGSMDNVNSAY
ncbi:transglycosylase SLT domain-containing protein [Streptomyces olivoreticuli]|uniref:transglycosylase SLT domain-containing protein n=1 Tax=Streptomyces olivoreticuli TaxID=68246 RepID=UPI000E23C1A7|nr:transglycosylase SLT domain-containing protein [Streptomyces olivoreticuli]